MILKNLSNLEVQTSLVENCGTFCAPKLRYSFFNVFTVPDELFAEQILYSKVGFRLPSSFDF